MKLRSNYLRATIGIALSWLSTSFGVTAQIVPDATLRNNSVVNIEGQVQRITGGTTAGGNLFHSFREFSLPTGGTAHFDNALNIQNILTRVTGKSVSNIDGLIRANAGANLFLINPNGIIFGPNARLNVGGSFIGSSADSIKFADRSEFSATNPSATPLLTVSVPIGLQVGPNPGSIQVRGRGNQVELDPETFATIGVSGEGLKVPDGKTLALVGGEVALVGGNLTSVGGRIEIGSVREALVTLTPTNSGYSLSYLDALDFQDILLSGASAINTSGSAGGNVQLLGRRVTFTEGSGILANTSGTENGGIVSVTAKELVELSGTNPLNGSSSFWVTETTGEGAGGEVTIFTGRLLLRDGAQLSSGSFSSGRAGNITAIASESVELIGTSPDGQFTSGLSAAAYGSGNAGTLTVNTRTLTLRDGSQVTSATFDEGLGGNLTVNASDSVELIGTSVDGEVPSLLSSSTFGNGDAGTLTINTRTLAIRDGAQVVSATLGSGRGGNITAIALDSVELIGASANSRSGLFASAIEGTGDGGNLTIVTGNLIVRDGAVASSSNFHSRNLLPPGSGAAGNIEVMAGSILLDGGATLTAAANAGDKGNITLQSRDIQLRRGSAITTNASGPATGGNIAIDTDTLAALENSDITANAVESFGGNVAIAALGVFGTEFRQQLTLASDITATSALGAQFSGTVEITTPDVDPSSGLVDLSTNVIDVTGLIAQNLCALAKKGSSFVVTGKGGLPPNPHEPLTSAVVAIEWANRLELMRGSSATDFGSRMNDEADNLINPASKIIHPSLEEATGWIVAPDGKIILTTSASQVTPSSPGLTHPSCL